MALPVVGDVFAGKYAIEAVVGRGGMGVVLAARHLELDERVAIKLILTDDGVASAEVLARFVREAKLASKIKSEHVVRILDVARLETGQPYIVMELLEGQDLAELLTKSGPLSVDQATLYVLQACEAIAEAHALGIVHRDLKPANLFLTTRRDGRPCVKVLDFGISKLLGEGGAPSVTKTDMLMGSPLYMSPDQLLIARDVDARSDVWSLGVILFELLTGRGPFDGEDAPQLIAQILHRPAPSLLTLRPDAPAELAALVAAALVKDRDQRLPNVAELSRGLAPFVPEIGRFSVQRIDGLMSHPSSRVPSATQGQTWRTGSGAVASGTPSGIAGGAALDLSSTRKNSLVRPIGAMLGVLLAAMAVIAFFAMRQASAPAAIPTAPQAATLAPLPTTSPAIEAPNDTATSPTLPPPGPTPEATASAPPRLPKPIVPAPPRAAAGLHPKPLIKPGASTPADPFGGVR